LTVKKATDRRNKTIAGNLSAAFPIIEQEQAKSP